MSFTYIVIETIAIVCIVGILAALVAGAIDIWRNKR